MHQSDPSRALEHQPQPLERYAAGRLIGSYRWIEKQLFHVLGGWIDSVPEPAVKLFLDQQSFEHAWHAQLWSDRLPELRAVSAAGLTAPANAGVAEVFRDLVADAQITDTIDKLSAIYRVILPRLVVAYSAHLDPAVSAGKDPTQRALRLILADEQTAWRAGEAHLQMLLTDKAKIEQSLDQHRHIEALLVQAGGVSQLTT